MNEVFQKLERIKIAELHFNGFSLEISNTLLCVWISCLILILLGFFASKNLQTKPNKIQVVVEMLVVFVLNMCKDNIGQKHYSKYVPYLGSLFLFICVANLLAVFNFIPGISLYPPTKDINTTIPLAVLTILIVLFSSIRFKGFKGTAKDLAKPMAIMIPFKIMEYATKPLSLCLRLFGNVVAAFLIMELVFMYLAPIAAPFSAYFDFFDGILQAYVFVFLTCLYIGEAVEMEGEVS